MSSRLMAQAASQFGTDASFTSSTHSTPNLHPSLSMMTCLHLPPFWPLAVATPLPPSSVPSTMFVDPLLHHCHSCQVHPDAQYRQITSTIATVLRHTQMHNTARITSTSHTPQGLTFMHANQTSPLAPDPPGPEMPPLVPLVGSRHYTRESQCPT